MTASLPRGMGSTLWVTGLIVIVVGALVAPLVLAPYPLTLLSLVCIAALLASSVNLLLGQVGLLSMGQAGIAAAAGYAIAWGAVRDVDPLIQIGLALGRDACRERCLRRHDDAHQWHRVPHDQSRTGHDRVRSGTEVDQPHRWPEWAYGRSSPSAGGRARCVLPTDAPDLAGRSWGDPGRHPLLVRAGPQGHPRKRGPDEQPGISGGSGQIPGDAGGGPVRGKRRDARCVASRVHESRQRPASPVPRSQS